MKTPCKRDLSVCILSLIVIFDLSASQLRNAANASENRGKIIQDSVRRKLIFINTAFENASQLDWQVDSSGAVNIGLIYDHERSSPNQANGHWHFQIQAEPGADLTILLSNFDNVWNGKKASPVSGKTNCLISQDGIHWVAIATDLISGNRLQFQIHMDSDKLYVASVEPYRISDLEKLMAEIRLNQLVEITPVGRTVEGRPLEIIRVGNPDAPFSILLRARAHGWEPGGNWVVQGLIRSLLQKDAAAYLKKYCVYIMPMANKDAVARGRTRFNSLGLDLNRAWDSPADSQLAPEKYALENWLKHMIQKGMKPTLAIDLHNDSGGNLHVNLPSPDNAQYTANLKRFETLLYKHTWFTEGKANVNNPGSFGEGLAHRFNIDACVYELNYEWIAGLNKVPFGKDWELLGQQLREVFFQYFDAP